jgi:hypothetical protein
MARPGLEPGTPRFSVVDQNLSNSGGIRAIQRVLVSDRGGVDVRKLRSFVAGLGTERRFGAQWVGFEPVSHTENEHAPLALATRHGFASLT